MINKVVINDRWGGYSLTKKAVEKLAEYGDKKAKKLLKNNEDGSFLYYDFKDRSNKNLIRVVEELGKEAGYDLKVVKVKSDKYRICEYDGLEWVETPESIKWIKFKK
jgi:hypothetical protein